MRNEYCVAQKPTVLELKSEPIASAISIEKQFDIANFDSSRPFRILTLTNHNWLFFQLNPSDGHCVHLHIRATEVWAELPMVENKIREMALQSW